MIKIPCLLLSAICYFMSFNDSHLDIVRANYNKLLSDKELCKKMILELTETKNNSATDLAYLGSSQAVWANHVFSPISKLSTFKEGTKNIELAIEKEPYNVELRFIRLSIQKNTSSFLRYKSNIKEDTDFIKKNRQQIGSDIVQENIRKVLKD